MVTPIKEQLRSQKGNDEETQQFATAGSCCHPRGEGQESKVGPHLKRSGVTKKHNSAGEEEEKYPGFSLPPIIPSPATAFLSVFSIWAAVTKMPEARGLNNKHLFLISPEAGSPRTRQIRCLLKAHFLVHRWLFSRSSDGGRGEGALWGLLYKGTNPIHEGSTLMT